MVAKTRGERDHEARQAKLEHVREQVASGQLLIRKMTNAERAKWAKRSSAFEANSTPAERARRATAIRDRRRRAARIS